MPYYEVTYETGRSSIAFYEDEAECLAACGEQHRRAANGEPGGPVGAPAERVVRIREYDKHPDNYNPDQTMSADVASKEVADLVKTYTDDNGVVNTAALAEGVKAIAHPMVQGKKHTFDSNFKMKEKKELTFDFDGGN